MIADDFANYGRLRLLRVAVRRHSHMEGLDKTHLSNLPALQGMLNGRPSMRIKLEIFESPDRLSIVLTSFQKLNQERVSIKARMERVPFVPLEDIVGSSDCVSEEHLNGHDSIRYVHGENAM